MIPTITKKQIGILSMYATLTRHFETIVVERAGAVVYLTLDRPDARNAMNLQMVQEICDFFQAIREDRSIRCVMIRGAGSTFCSGADIKELNRNNGSAEASAIYARALDTMLLAVQRAPQVTIVLVEGAAMGGGFGLVCVTDIAVADEKAFMALPEVRLGITPAVISPYVIERIGLTRTRQLALTGRRLNGKTAFDLGLVQEVAPSGTAEQVVEGYVADILQGGPHALATTKALLFHVAERPIEESLTYRVETLAALSTGEEGREGLTAFAQKRKPEWIPAED
jgi:isohexenylglutaconyl-CoA hydratase